MIRLLLLRIILFFRRIPMDWELSKAATKVYGAPFAVRVIEHGSPVYRWELHFYPRGKLDSGRSDILPSDEERGRTRLHVTRSVAAAIKRMHEQEAKEAQ